MEKAIAYIQSLNKGKMTSTEVDEVTILEKIGDNLYICDYKGTICTGIFNYFRSLKIIKSTFIYLKKILIDSSRKAFTQSLLRKMKSHL